MALPPRQLPFPYSEFFFDARGIVDAQDREDALSEFVSDPANEGVQLNVRLTGSSWSDEGSWYAPGVAESGDWVSVNYGMCLPDDELNTWGYMVNISPATPLPAAWRSDVQGNVGYNGFTVSPGEYTYPCVFATNGNLGAGGSGTYWYNAPVSYETWFSTNDTRVNKDIGFSGYTGFADQGNTSPTTSDVVTAHVPADTYRRRYVVGILRRNADLASCSPADIMLGMLMTSNGVTTTSRLCHNGVAVATRSFTTPTGGAAFNSAQCYIETAWSGSVDDIGEWAGVVSDCSMWSNGAHDFVSHYPGGLLSSGFDTYDVKWAWLIDDFSPTHLAAVPVETPTGDPVATYFAVPPNMFTAPNWAITPSTAPVFWQDLSGTTETP